MNSTPHHPHQNLLGQLSRAQFVGLSQQCQHGVVIGAQLDAQVLSVQAHVNPFDVKNPARPTCARCGNSAPVEEETTQQAGRGAPSPAPEGETVDAERMASARSTGHVGRALRHGRASRKRFRPQQLQVVHPRRRNAGALPLADSLRLDAAQPGHFGGPAQALDVVGMGVPSAHGR